MPVRPTLLLTAVVAAAGALLVQQADLNPFAEREYPFSTSVTDQATSTGPVVANRAVPARDTPESGAVVPAAAPERIPRAAPTSEGDTQIAQTPQTSPPARDTTVQPGIPAVDETALRYFAARGDSRRLEAEIARLRALYPQWTPPDDPLAALPQGDSELDAMWRLYAEGKMAEVRKAIADRQAREPNWQVPADLLDRLQLGEAREQLVNASEIKQFDTVVRVAASNPAMLTCGDVDVLWRVAEAFAQTDRKPRAVDAYQYILANCERPEERLATVQKAMDLLPRSDLEQLLAAGRMVDGRPEFEAVRGEMARRALVEADADPSIVVSPADLALVETLATDAGAESDYLLLGWYYLRRDNPRVAEDWFRKARAKQNDAASAQGLALALVNQDKPQEAESILYEWRNASEDVRAVYLAAVANMLALLPPPQFSAEVLQRVVAEVVEARDAGSAQQLGWYADNFNQFETAEQWFRTALDWKPDDEPSAYGLALMRWKLGDLAGAREVQVAWAGRSERIPTVGEPSVETAAIGVRQRRQVEVGRADEPAALRPVQTTVAVASDGLDRPAAVLRPAAQDAPPRRRASPAAASASQPAEQPRRSSARQTTDRPRTAGCRTTEDPEGLSPAAALNRGWCLMNANRPIEAAAAFEVALRGHGQTRDDAAYGQSLAYMRAGLTDRAAVAATKAPIGATRGAEINAAILAARANSAYQNGRYMETILALDERTRFAPEQTDLMVLRGYAYLNLVRYGDAERIFRAAASTGNRDAMRGLNDLRAARQPDPDG